MVSDTLLGVSALLGVATVPVTSALKGEKWPVQLKFALALIITAIVASIQTIVSGRIHSVTGFLSLWAVTVASAQTFYHTYFGGTSFEQQLSKIGHLAGKARNVVDQAAPVVNVLVKDNKTAEGIVTNAEQAVDKVVPTGAA